MSGAAEAAGVVAGVTVRIDRLLCVGFGDCIDVAPGIFEFDDEGIARFREPAAEADRQLVLDACRSCPVDALTAMNSDGTVLAP
jgi:ferredoxin